jgi:flagellar hook-basal body complex protein FliE
MIPPVSGLGVEWQLPGVGAVSDPPGVSSDVAGAGGSGGFGGMLSQQIDNLSNLQDTATAASQSLADGTATDVSSVVTAVEKAQLAMQLAGQIRTKGSEAINDVFHTQI